MLSPANRDLVVRDPALPGLALLLDPAELMGWLREGWPDAALSGLEATYLRYKPGTSCLAGFRLCSDGIPTWLTLTARRRDARDKLGKPALKPGVPGRFGPGRQLFADLALTMAVFPNDRVLKSLRCLADARETAHLLERVTLPRSARIAALRYRPERRFVGRVEQDGQSIAVIKLHGPHAFSRCFANASAFASIGSLVVPKRIGGAERHGAVASTWLEGFAAASDAASAERIGEALALLHGQDAPQLAVLSPGEQQAGAWAIADDLGALLPDLAGRARGLAQRLAPLLDGPEPGVALHGDFHLEQVLDLETRIALVDFDEAARGPAAWDIGNLLAHRAAEGASAAACEALAAALLNGYRTTGRMVRDRDIAAQTALGLLRIAARPFREQQPDWPARIEHLLTLAEATCPSSPARIAADPALPQLEAALNLRQAATAFAAAGLAVTVAAARVVRHKPGRRALIAYDLVDGTGRRSGAFGKIRAKGADSRVYALQRELWLDGFAAGGRASARVAEPLALVPELALWLQAAVPCTDFTTASVSPEAAARAIGALHMARIRPLKRHLLADELALLAERLAALALRQPGWGARLDALMQAARTMAAQAVPVALRPIHRDFYHDHLLFDGTEFHLIDLDLLCLGDPAVDIGNFNAHLTERALREAGDPCRDGWWQTRFAHAACRAPHGARICNVRVYEFLSLLRLIEIADRMPQRRGTAPALLALCETLAEAVPIRSRSPS